MTKYWGPITWVLIHSLYQNINQDKFNKIYIELNQLIYNIITLLPCDNCKQHAIQYLKNNRFNIRENNLKNMQQFFYNFHNNVNRRLNKPQFNDFDKYNNINLNIIIYKFAILFPKNVSNTRSLATNLHRKLLVNKLIKLYEKL